jgi:hypothetical protein
VQPWTGKIVGALLAVAALCLVVVVGHGQEVQRVTVSGVVFTLPQGYLKVPGPERANFAFLYDTKNKNGMVLTVPTVPFVEKEVEENLKKVSLSTFFPKETRPYVWKSPNQLQKVSKFEVGDFLGKGFNQNSLLVFESRHIKFEEKDVFVATIFEARRGRLAKDMFNGEGTAMSMTTCRAAVEVIYALTGEKIDSEKPPCELIANIP